MDINEANSKRKLAEQKLEEASSILSELANEMRLNTDSYAAYNNAILACDKARIILSKISQT